MSRSRAGLPLMQCVLVKTASGATGNESGDLPKTKTVPKQGTFTWKRYKIMSH